MAYIVVRCEMTGCPKNGHVINRISGFAPDSACEAVIEAWADAHDPEDICTACHQLGIQTKATLPRRLRGIAFHRRRVDGRKAWSICPVCALEFPMVRKDFESFSLSDEAAKHWHTHDEQPG